MYANEISAQGDYLSWVIVLGPRHGLFNWNQFSIQLDTPTKMFGLGVSGSKKAFKRIAPNVIPQSYQRFFSLNM